MVILIILALLTSLAFIDLTACRLIPSIAILIANSAPGIIVRAIFTLGYETFGLAFALFIGVTPLLRRTPPQVNMTMIRGMRMPVVGERIRVGGDRRYDKKERR
ncbi:hypothetical protein FRC03_006463 [Tulasnella sp. 419]|nr:hypothetical protein FRC03_006463 [Tulasnella sp. 419]